MEEIWKDVAGWEGIYQVSSFGRIRRLTTRGGRPLPEPRILKEKCDGNGYLMVCLSNKVHKYVHVHHLVAVAFISNPSNLPCINHKDENKKNNRVENLEWCTHQYNNVYGTKLIRYSETRGHAVNQYDLEGNFIKRFRSAQHAEMETFGRISCRVNRCCTKNRHGIIKQSGGYIWKWAD